MKTDLSIAIPRDTYARIDFVPLRDQREEPTYLQLVTIRDFEESVNAATLQEDCRLA